MTISRQYSFWGSLSPLGGLTGAGLLIMASARLSWAITIAGSLFWVYGLTTLSFTSLLSVLGDRFFPVSGRITLFACLAAFFGSTYLLMFWLLCPFAALEVFVLLLLVPMFCTASGVIQQISKVSVKTRFDIKPANKKNSALQGKKQGELGDRANISNGNYRSPIADSPVDVYECLSNAVSQAASLAGLLIAFSIIREPLSYCSLSFPGSSNGMVTIMYFSENSFFPIGLFSHSAGALLLMGYITCLYQYGKERLFPGEYK